ncbi:MAG: hypothetical protein GF370_03720 [Candidatus Nealsonbacteria bacterium]|nr:hypothetical protein [Candidatus Nealsonbacteria bacterium]
MKLKFYIPRLGTVVIKGRDKEKIKKKLVKMVKKMETKENLKPLIFDIERQIEASKKWLKIFEIVPGSFGRGKKNQEETTKFEKEIIEDNKQFLKFLKEEFGIELTEEERGSFYKQLFQQDRPYLS